MPEVRLIDANAAADKIMHEVEVHADEIGIGAVAIMIAFARAMRDETDFPTIEPEVRHGRWIEESANEYYCSYCGKYAPIAKNMRHCDCSKWCKECGTKMDGGADNGNR